MSCFLCRLLLVLRHFHPQHSITSSGMFAVKLAVTLAVFFTGVFFVGMVYNKKIKAHYVRDKSCPVNTETRSR